MAKAELMRRRGINVLPSGITPQLAQEERIVTGKQIGRAHV